jgi:hypothetical protein
MAEAAFFVCKIYYVCDVFEVCGKRKCWSNSKFAITAMIDFNGEKFYSIALLSKNR